MTTLTAWGLGLATITDSGQTLDVWYPAPVLGPKPAEGNPALLAELSALEQGDPQRRVRTAVVQVTADLSAPPDSTADAYLRLHLLSHRLVLPNTINLEGIFARLANVVWTSLGPCSTEDFGATQMRLRQAGRPIIVYGIDKFPRMVDYVLPPGVRIADADRVRLGAHLAEGTTVMHEGFVNFNAGTLGQCMVEGRISQGVVIGDGSDVGGGASMMGTLSGGGQERVRLGKGCLLGANSGLGIPLGDNCVVEAGLYITAGTKVTVMSYGGVVPGDRGRFVEPPTVPARELAGADNILFRRNSVSGRVEALSRDGKGMALNPDLHISQYGRKYGGGPSLKTRATPLLFFAIVCVPR